MVATVPVATVTMVFWKAGLMFIARIVRALPEGKFRTSRSERVSTTRDHSHLLFRVEGPNFLPCFFPIQPYIYE